MINIKEYIKQTFLFEGLNNTETESLIEGLTYNVSEYSRGDIIYSPESFSSEVGFVLSGECEVLQHTCDGGKVILNTLRAKDSFGILAVFRDGVFPTEVYAKRRCEVLFISKEELLKLIGRSPNVALNIIKFLAERVGFLNSRLETTTLGTVDKKLASYLLSFAKEAGKDSFALNFKRCSETICAGRASVYRSINSLRNRGYIEAENKIIKILDKEKMEDFIK